MRRITLLMFCLIILGNNASAIKQIFFEKIDTIEIDQDKIQFVFDNVNSLKGSSKAECDEIFIYTDSIVSILKDTPVKGQLNLKFAELYFERGDFRFALQYLLQAERLFVLSNMQMPLGVVYNKLGSVYINQGDFPVALNYFHKSLTIKDSIGDWGGLAKTYNNIGNIYFEQQEFDNALHYFNKSIAIDDSINNNEGKAITYMNIGLVYYELFELEKAEASFIKSLKVHEQSNNQIEIARCYSNLALVCIDNGLDAQALSYYDKSLQIYEQLNAKQGTALTLFNIGFYYQFIGDYEKAITYLKKAIRIAQDIESDNDVEKISQVISDTYYRLGKFKEAYHYYVLYKKMYDKLNSEESTRKFTQLSMNYEFDQQRKELEFEQVQKDLAHEAAIKRQQLMLLYSSIGVLFLLVFVFFVFRSYKRKQRDNLLLQKQKSEIEGQRDKIDKQKEEITDSIHYAKRIQSALLPPYSMIDDYLKEYFILYKPRDIVSGDYYWFSVKDEKAIMVTADCTGHGVPGAFMSMLGIAFLNEIIQREVTLNAAEILNSLRNQLVKSLHQTGKFGESKDGMDLALTIIDKNNMTLQYAGAYNPLFLIRGGELTQYKADKMPIGISDKIDQPFTPTNIDLKKGDAFYTFSDGYVDQFGGPNDKKFMTKHFKALLIKENEKPMVEQKVILDTQIEEWRGGQSQIDDIIVVGIRI